MFDDGSNTLDECLALALDLDWTNEIAQLSRVP